MIDDIMVIVVIFSAMYIISMIIIIVIIIMIDGFGRSEERRPPAQRARCRQSPVAARLALAPEAVERTCLHMCIHIHIDR